MISTAETSSQTDVSGDAVAVRSVIRVAFESTELGVFQDSIVCLDRSSNQEFRLPVCGNRVPFLSSIPQQVILGSRPARAFLRCPDRSVELTKILEVPTGIRAVLASPREVLIETADRTQNTIDADVVVATTAIGHPPLGSR
jgi:hypothetical protein